MRVPPTIAAAALAACSFQGSPNGEGLGSDADTGSDASPTSDAAPSVDSTAVPTCVPPPSGLLAWWDGETLGNDLTGIYPGGAVRGNPGVDPDGYVGATARYDNNEQISFANAPASATFSIEGWVRRRGNDTDFRTIYGEFVDAGLFLFEHRLAYYERRASGGAGDNVAAGTTELQNNVWYHVASTWDGATVVLYVNGVVEATELAPVLVTLPGPAAASGGLFDGILGDNQSFRGDIDELTVYSRALTDLEVRSIFDADSHGKCKPTTN